MGYIRDTYGKGSDDFIKGFLAAMDTYAVWKDGRHWIGSPEKLVREEQNEVIKELGGTPETFLGVNYAGGRVIKETKMPFIGLFKGSLIALLIMLILILIIPHLVG